MHHIQADLAQVRAELQWVLEQADLYLHLDRPLTPAEIAEVRALTGEGHALHLRLQTLRAEWAWLRGGHPPPRDQQRSG